MDNTVPSIWRETFANWPAQFRRKGVIEPVQGDSIPFVDFVMTNDMVVLERATPDNNGARRVSMPFHNIGLLKYTEPLKTEAFIESGFVKGGEKAPEPKAKRKKVPIKPVTAGEPKPAKASETKPVAKETPRPPINPDAIHLSGPTATPNATAQQPNTAQPNLPPQSPPARAMPSQGGASAQQPGQQPAPAAPAHPGQTQAPPQPYQQQPAPGVVPANQMPQTAPQPGQPNVPQGVQPGAPYPPPQQPPQAVPQQLPANGLPPLPPIPSVPIPPQTPSQ